MLPDVEKMYKKELDGAQERWNRLKAKLSKDLHLLEEIASKLRAFEVNPEAIRSLSLLQGKWWFSPKTQISIYWSILHSF